MSYDVYPIVKIPNLRYYYGFDALGLSFAGKLVLDESESDGKPGAVYRWKDSGEEYMPTRGPCTDEECPCHEEV